MKFGQLLLNATVPEWRGKYVNYKQLKKRLKRIRVSTLAVAANFFQNAASEESNFDVQNVEEEKAFFVAVQADIAMVNAFYKEQLDKQLDAFHALIAQAVMLKLITKYQPSEQTYQTKLQKELFRLKSAASGGVAATALVAKSRWKNKIGDEPEVGPSRGPVRDPDQLLSRSKSGTVTVGGVPVKNRAKLKSAFAEFYRGLVLLQGYVDINRRAVEKILKKHDKNILSGHKEQFIKDNVEPLEFYRHAGLQSLVSEAEYQFSLIFTEGHRGDAMRELRMPWQHRPRLPAVFRLAFTLGLSLPLIFAVGYVWGSVDTDEFPRFDSVISVYRMVLMSILIGWAWAIDMLIWTRYRINYVFIFQFNARAHARYLDILEGVSLFTLIWAFLAYLYLMNGVAPAGFEWLAVIPWQVYPGLLLLLTIGVVIWFQIKSNFWLMRTLLSIVGAPFFYVQFRDFFLADQLVSVSLVLVDMEYTACFFAYDAWTGADVCRVGDNIIASAIVVLPSFWRLLQCMRRYHDVGDKWQMVNAGKYFSSILVAVASALRTAYPGPGLLAVWLVFIVFSTCYTYLWDVRRDWGLGHRQYGMLRRDLLYPKALYYVALPSNFVLRLMWTLTVSPGSLGIVMDPRGLTTLLTAVEIVRRGLWNLFRLENEQLNNAEKFRATELEVPSVDAHGVSNSIHSDRYLPADNQPNGKFDELEIADVADALSSSDASSSAQQRSGTPSKSPRRTRNAVTFADIV